MSFRISYQDLIKFPSFVVVTTERGDRGWKTWWLYGYLYSVVQLLALYSISTTISNPHKTCKESLKVRTYSTFFYPFFCFSTNPVLPQHQHNNLHKGVLRTHNRWINPARAKESSNELYAPESLKQNSKWCSSVTPNGIWETICCCFCFSACP